VDARNTADALIYTTEKSIKEFDDKMDRVTYIILLFDTQNYFLYNFKIKKNK